MSVVILRGDAAALPLPDSSVDAVVTDPPYGLEFMGREWDTFRPSNARIRERVDGRTNPAEGKSVTRTPEAYVAGAAFGEWCEAWAAECLRVLKPGGYLAAFGGTRTYHWLACGIETAGFEIRDSLHWLYGSGFPKGRACLKPAHEPIVLARRPAPRSAPLPGLDACRVGAGGYDAGPADRAAGGRGRDEWRTGTGDGPHALADTGRWPPNVLLGHAEGCEPAGTRRVRASAGGAGGRRFSSREYAQDAYSQAMERGERPTYADADGLETVEAWDCAPGCPVAELDRQAGPRRAGGDITGNEPSAKFKDSYGEISTRSAFIKHRDEGGPSRFFPIFRYEAKAAAAERPQLADGTAWPTVKPVALMQWLVRLVTPPGGTVLDPFCGTGTTGQACAIEGFNAVLLDRDPQAIALTQVRLAKPVQPSLFGLEDTG